MERTLQIQGENICPNSGLGFVALVELRAGYGAVPQGSVALLRSSRSHRVGADGDGLDDAVVPDALGKFQQRDLLEGAAWIGGGFVNGIDG